MSQLFCLGAQGGYRFPIRQRPQTDPHGTGAPGLGLPSPPGHPSPLKVTDSPPPPSVAPPAYGVFRGSRLYEVRVRSTFTIKDSPSFLCQLMHEYGARSSCMGPYRGSCIQRCSMLGRELCLRLRVQSPLFGGEVFRGRTRIRYEYEYGGGKRPCLKCRGQKEGLSENSSPL